VPSDELEFFLEMLKSKGQAKLDLRAEVFAEAELAVSFHGSYVVWDA
jgi:hypothetical protein